ncbi:MAG: hypothetical protein ACRDJM_01010, partial [Actinomycetota bacterium]
VGIMLFEALAGRKPFAGEPSVAHLAAARAGSIPSLRDVAPWVDAQLEAVVDRATAADPAARFGSADEMIAALDGTSEATFDRAPVTMRLPAPTPSPDATTELLQRVPEPARRNRPKRAVVAAAVLVAAGGLFAVLAITWERTSSRPEGPPRGTAAPRATVGPEVPGSLPAPLSSALDRLDRTIVEP